MRQRILRFRREQVQLPGGLFDRDNHCPVHPIARVPLDTDSVGGGVGGHGVGCLCGEEMVIEKRIRVLSRLEGERREFNKLPGFLPDKLEDVVVRDSRKAFDRIVDASFDEHMDLEKIRDGLLATEDVRSAHRVAKIFGVVERLYGEYGLPPYTIKQLCRKARTDSDIKSVADHLGAVRFRNPSTPVSELEYEALSHLRGITRGKH